MENDQIERSSDEFQDGFDFIFEQFNASLTALQLQDLHSSEAALVKAKAIYGNMNRQGNRDQNIPSQIIVFYIEIATRLLRATFYSYDERYKKALEELNAAKAVCDTVNDSFALIPPEFSEREGFSDLIDMFRFLFSFFERIVVTVREITTGTIEKINGKYVDEVAIFVNASRELRRLNDYNFELVGNGSEDFIAPMIGMMNRLADVYEKRAERLEEKRKKIEFLTPVDRRVFIVHGHSTGLLLELKEILKTSFEIEPVILSDELDSGNTLIEKFEHYGRLSAFAFVLITPDDWVENKKHKYFQARPNVLFELGWFCGRYGRDKVRILRQKETPLPSDLNGIVTIDFNEKLEEVFRRINRDLEAVGII